MLDPTFGAGTGFFRPAFNAPVFSSVALQPDGRILAAGTLVAGAPAPGFDMVAVRLTGAGALDGSYGGAPGGRS